jgi:hypothetical protein
VLEDEERARGGGGFAEEFERDETVVTFDGVDARGAGVFDGGEFGGWVLRIEAVRGAFEIEPGPRKLSEVLRCVGHGGMMICGRRACNWGDNGTRITMKIVESK